MSSLDPGWIPMREAAERMEVPMWRARRRLKKLDAAQGGGVLRRWGPRGFLYVDVARLERHLRRPEVEEQRVEALEARVAELELKLDALRRAFRSLRRRVATPSQCDVLTVS